MPKPYYVYVLMDPRKPGPFRYGWWKFSHEPFYVGKGKGGRAYQHMTTHSLSARNPHKNRKILSIQRAGLQPLVVVKHKEMSEKQALTKEIQLIARIGRHSNGSGPLTNATDGGDKGVPGYVHSENARTRMSKAQKQRFKTKEAREEASNRNKKTWEDMPEAKKKERCSKLRQRARTYWNGLSDFARKRLGKARSKIMKSTGCWTLDQALIARKEKQLRLLREAKSVFLTSSVDWWRSLETRQLGKCKRQISSLLAFGMLSDTQKIRLQERVTQASEAVIERGQKKRAAKMKVLYSDPDYTNKISNAVSKGLLRMHASQPKGLHSERVKKGWVTRRGLK